MSILNLGFSGIALCKDDYLLDISFSIYPGVGLSSDEVAFDNKLLSIVVKGNPRKILFYEREDIEAMLGSQKFDREVSSQ